MERVGVLIHKLLDQYNQQADASHLLITAQMLLNELQQPQSNAHANGVIAVSLPASALQSNQPLRELKAHDRPVENTTVTPSPPPPAKEPETHLPYMPQWASEPAEDIPTLPQKEEKQDKQEPQHRPEKQGKQVFELNDAMTKDEESLNDRLRIEQIELSSVLKDAPIRDLRKAIGINDRYLFLHELFRGDETMYERSIKTINSFGIYAEAEYWIKRELKFKLTWDEQSPAVKLFDQLVKRRFF